MWNTSNKSPTAVRNREVPGLVYIAPCQEVVVELPFMIKQIARVKRPSKELCKECPREAYCREYHTLVGDNYGIAGTMTVSEEDVCKLDDLDY